MGGRGLGPCAHDVPADEHRPERLHRFLRAWARKLAGQSAGQLGGRPPGLEGDSALCAHGLGRQLSAQLTAEQARRTDLYLRELASRAEQVAADLSALGVADEEPVREVGRRLGASAEAVRGAAAAITDAAEDLGRGRARGPARGPARGR